MAPFHILAGTFKELDEFSCIIISLSKLENFILIFFASIETEPRALNMIINTWSPLTAPPPKPNDLLMANSHSPSPKLRVSLLFSKVTLENTTHLGVRSPPELLWLTRSFCPSSLCRKHGRGQTNSLSLLAALCPVQAWLLLETQ